MSLSLTTERNDLSEFGLNLSLNFIGKKNGGAGEINIFSILRISHLSINTFIVVFLIPTVKI